MSGEDATSFLQGQFTNDVRALATAPGIYGLWLTVKGKVLADSFIVRGESGAYWIGSYFSAAAVIRERLESHVIADDVSIEDETAAWTAVTVFGAEGERLFEQPPETGVVFRGRRARDAHVEWLLPAGSAALVRNRFPDTLELDADTMRRLRIGAGIPAVPEDLGPADLPNEGALETDAISYTKGCYLGQEVMARLKSMGHVRRRLLRVRGTGAGPSTLPAPVFAGERQVGEVRSAVTDGASGWIGFAMVSLLHVNAATPLSFAPNAPAGMQWLDTP